MLGGHWEGWEGKVLHGDGGVYSISYLWPGGGGRLTSGADFIDSMNRHCLFSSINRVKLHSVLIKREVKEKRSRILAQRPLPSHGTTF